MSVINDALKKAEDKSQNNETQTTGNPVLTPKPVKKERSWLRIFILLTLVLGGLLYVGYTQLMPLVQKRIMTGLKEKADELSKDPRIKNKLQNAKLQNLLSQGRASFEVNQLEHSLKLFQDAYRLFPNNAEVLNDIGMVYRKQGNLSEALKYYKLALEKDPQCAPCQNNIGVIYSKQNNKKKAEKAFLKSLSSDSKYSDPHFNLALLFEKQNKKDDAIKHFQNFIDKATKKQSKLVSSVQEHIEDLIE